MGSFIGHVIPGSFFILFGVWWIIQITRKYLWSLSRKTEPFRATATFPPKLKCQNLDLEALLALSAGIIGMIIELFIANVMVGKSIGVNNGQHATMYFFFSMVGLIGILAPTLRKLLPNIEHFRYLSLALAYTAEALLFKFHLFGRDGMDIMVHTLLLYAVYGCIILTLAEMVRPTQVLLPLGRAFFTVLQGSWFWQTAFILYNPIPGHAEWDHENHHQTMLITCFFTWHMGFIFLFILLCGIGWSCAYKKAGYLDESDLTMDNVATDRGYRHLINHVDDETDMKTMQNGRSVMEEETHA